jgi:hypothetical protein
MTLRGSNCPLYGVYEDPCISIILPVKAPVRSFCLSKIPSGGLQSERSQKEVRIVWSRKYEYNGPRKLEAGGCWIYAVDGLILGEGGISDMGSYAQ